MRVAITVTTDAGLEAGLDSRFGRAFGFLVCDTENEMVEFVPNQQNLNAAQGAGIQAAQTVVASDVQAVITANCGPKAFRVLNVSGVAVYNHAGGSAADALKLFKEGKLQQADSANVEGHWA